MVAFELQVLKECYVEEVAEEEVIAAVTDRQYAQNTLAKLNSCKRMSNVSFDIPTDVGKVADLIIASFL